LAGIRASPGERVLRVGLVQPAIDPATHWDPAQRLAVIETEESLSLPLATSGADVVIWPEASAPFVFAEESFYDIDPDFFAEERKLRRRMLEFAQNLGVPLVFGAPAITSGTVGRGQVWNAVNRAFLLSPRGSIEAHYDKMILVPFGEYVPLPRILFFVDKLIPGMGTFLPGTDFTVFEAPKGRFAVFICYEAIFGDFVRRLAARDTDVLVNITNDAWFGDTSGPYQHFAMAVVRAVENRKPLVRVANTGISAVVDVDGRIRKELPLSQRAAENVEIRWTERSTFYTRFGDVFARLAALAALLMLLYAIVVGRTAKVSAAGLAERE
jgi:apolipoprotein N-acyltransferase